MKIAWLTPFSEKSAIGKYSAIAVSILSHRHDITIFYEPTEEDLYKTSLPKKKLSMSHKVIKELNDFDMVVYNFGDYLPYHKTIYEVYLVIPGIVILHDFIMLNFFQSYYSFRKLSKLVSHYYGLKNFKIRSIYDYIHYPLTELLCTNAYGVLTHGKFVKDYIEEKVSIPVVKVNFPYYADTFSHKVSINQHKSPHAKLQLLIVGYVNENKRIDKVMDAISKSTYLKKNIELHIVGPYKNEDNYYRKLKLLAKKNNITDIVYFHGYQSSEFLHAKIQDADVCINLRYPSFNAASWSFMEQLDAKKIVIVSDTDSYTDFSHPGIIKIPVDEKEIITIKNQLEKLIANKHTMPQLEDSISEYAHSLFTQEQYSKGFNALVNDVFKYKAHTDFMFHVAQSYENITCNTDLESFEKVVERMKKVMD